MNIENGLFENVCTEFSDLFSIYFDWDEIDLTYFRVDMENKEISIVSNNYEWQLICWDDDLDLFMEERLKSSIQYWGNYSEAYNITLEKSTKNKFKIDLCARYENSFEITTVNSNKQLTLSEMLSIYKHRPIISEYANQIWKKNPEVTLPMRANIPITTQLLGQTKNVAPELLNPQKYMRFGHIRFTRKEMITIRLLLSHCKVKEISYIQGCSEASENRRIQNIKEKLGCPYVSSSGLFAALKEQGITLACLETLIDLPLTNSIMKNR
ncbi:MULTISPECIES: helix-turn-helix transcriptional regulator [Providencia]|uniref:Uncharacterized protein n=1 Tax=Providencia rettgeri TaxID=587 RepID=A0AAD2ZKB9_PRORE|nr:MULTISPECIES: hypothetical protein [Providencia]ELR5217743.1 hypothetical protein [Providencia rettgeri]ELR5220528.1 hypothetical protein [Providencia rettgeri]MDX7323772.1 hypothetical protein [Providencia rettgeri]UPS61562.1 hypothetical protein M0M83_13120 [Providencia rettgeri]HEC8326331.1 hypothetical protein [Providencia rettgeri]